MNIIVIAKFYKISKYFWVPFKVGGDFIISSRTKKRRFSEPYILQVEKFFKNQ